MTDIANNETINKNGWINLNNLNEDMRWQNSNDVQIGNIKWTIEKINNTQEIEDYQDVDLRKIWKDITTKEKHWINKQTKLVIIFFVTIILTSVIGFFAFKYDKYIVDYSNWIENTNDNIAASYEKLKEKAYALIWKTYEKPNTPIELSDEIWKKNLTNLIQSNKWYIYKKETIKISLRNLFNTINNNTNRLDDAKKQLSTNWFFSSKLWSIIADDESITSIQDSLTAIEAIKFNSAISVFSKLDTFIASLSKELGIDKDVIMTNINSITKRWEKDINLYIKNCRLNTFEVDYNCNSIWDFEKYYDLTDDKEFNTKFFKKLIQFIDEKLEQTEVPSFSIKFRSFNKQTNELTFDIEINTFKEDEMELAKKWILSSHSFILTSLINNLKLSRAIVSEEISVNTIKPEQRTIDVWSTEFTVNTTYKTFSVPIKNENQIEIDDFLY